MSYGKLLHTTHLNASICCCLAALFCSDCSHSLRCQLNMVEPAHTGRVIDKEMVQITHTGRVIEKEMVQITLGCLLDNMLARKQPYQLSGT